MIEAYVILALIFGGVAGYGISKKPAPTETNVVAPMPQNWGAEKHRESMLMCKTVCDNKVEKYEPLTGECKCQNR